LAEILLAKTLRRRDELSGAVFRKAVTILLPTETRQALSLAGIEGLASTEKFLLETRFNEILFAWDRTMGFEHFPDLRQSERACTR